MTNPRPPSPTSSRSTASVVRLTFADGAVHEVDLASVLSAGGAFSSLRDDESVFRSVLVDRESGTIAWAGDVELDPDVLRGDQSSASGPLRRRIVQSESAESATAAVPDGVYGHTSSGAPITDSDLDRFVAEAVAGYDVDELLARPAHSRPEPESTPAGDDLEHPPRDR